MRFRRFRDGTPSSQHFTAKFPIRNPNGAKLYQDIFALGRAS